MGRNTVLCNCLYNSQRIRKSSNSIFTKAKNSIVAGAKSRYSKKGKINASAIASDITKLASLFNTENKHVDTQATAVTVTNASPIVYGIGTVAQGDADNQRSGDSIKIDRIDFFLSFQTSSATNTTDIFFRWFIIRYKKTPSSSGTVAFPVSELLAPDFSGTYYSSLSFPNTDTNENFHILQQGTHKMVPTSLLTSINRHTIESSVSCSFHQYYSGSASTTITDSMVFIVVVADTSTTSSTVQISSRMWYIDN
jgi:hypothetical protein